MTKHVFTAGAIAIACGVAVGCVLPVGKYVPKGREWATTSPMAETLTQDHRLIGLACGSDRLTMTAKEEDEFPITGCDTIEAIDVLCPPTTEGQWAGEPVTAVECARYLGDGW